MKKRLAMLLSVAMAFSMFANVAFGAEAQLTTKEKFEALVKDGIFAGVKDKDGNIDPQLNQHTDRAQFAKILALTAGLSKEEGNSFKDKGYSTSWAKGYIEAVTKAGFMSGVGQDKFDLKGKVTGEQMAKAFTLALGLKKVEDAPAVEGVSKWATGYVAAIKAAGFDFSVNGKWNVAVQRSVLVEAAYDVKQKTSVKVDSVKVIDEKTIEVKFTDGETVKHTLDTALVEGKETTVEVTHKGAKHQVKVTLQALAIEAKTVGAKTFEVKLNRTVDTAKAKFEVKRGSTAIDVKTATYSDDKLTYRVEAANKLSEGEYTINLVVGDKTVSAKAKVEAEKVTKIELIGEEAATNDKYTELKIPFKVLNQYGEDASKIASLNWTVSKGTHSVKDGVLNISTTDKFNYKEAIAVMVHDAKAGVVANKTYTVGLPSRAHTVEVKSLYNIDNQKLTSSTDLTNSEFYLLIDVKDQYGNKVDKEDVKKNVIALSNNPLALNVETYAQIDKGPHADSAAIKLKAPSSDMFRQSGEVEITITALGSGQKLTHKVNVEQGTELKSFQLQHPTDIVAANDKKVKIPFEAYGVNGEKITKFKELNKMEQNSALNLSDNLQLFEDKKTGDAYLEYNVESAHKGLKGYAYLMATVTKGAVSSNIQFEIKDAATPKAIKGFHKDVAKAYGEGATAELNKDKIEILDQYSRAFKLADLPVEAGKDVYVGISNVKKINEGTHFNISATGATYNTGEVIAYKNADNVKINLTADKKGEQVVELALFHNVNGVLTAIPDSQTTVVLSVVAQDNISSYEIKPLGTLYAGDKNIFSASTATYSKDLKVVGKRGNGDEIVLSTNQYTVSVDPNYVTTSNNGRTLTAVKMEKAESVELDLTVLVNGAGLKSDEVRTKLTVSNKPQQIQELKTDKDKVGGNVTAVDGELVTIKAGTTNLNDVLGVIKAKDQYGLEGHLNSVANGVTVQVNRIVGTDGKTKALNVTNNGSKDAAFATGAIAAGDTVYVTVAVHGKVINLVLDVKA
ncbi:S-layer homology domain-containing protein [Paenibacillus arenosi]|uniref:S-layer homology domain-containing protein n=1 Tax=Paenibacillus arenosi TaxID=2774142 RepID=A0ABR9AWH1_9BACL|nr:S-layer homology domain-containing protein [Paenibacillus arenosi]MBD8498236.1 S-layer homology domain-containing protein [Paenibacillus arenosi]